MRHAPSVRLGNGRSCIPQHYLSYRHTLGSVERLLLDTDYDARYLVFACADEGGIYIQIGIIGYDNYRPLKAQARQKIVYGRKWRVEPHLPTSEIIQTTFLALQKAREHEVRERLRFYKNGAYTTPFNNHQDLPLMANNPELLALPAKEDTPLTHHRLSLALKALRYDDAALCLHSLTRLPDGSVVVQIALEATANSQLPEVVGGGAKGETLVSFILSRPKLNDFYYALMAALVQLSNQHVEEHFCYRNFARFSRKNSVLRLANMSGAVRRPERDEGFAQTFVAANYEIDSARVPLFRDGALADKNRTALASFGKLNGILPRE